MCAGTRPGGAKSLRMTFSWFRRPARHSPPVLSSLDRLAELVERVIALVEEVAPAPIDGHVLFAPAAGGYRLLVREGVAPACGAELELEGGRFRVLRHGPSPLPGDLRRCALLERQEPLQPDRSFDR